MTTQQWPARSQIVLFVHNLHLLDLDQLDDWPNVTTETFAAKASLQHRIRCVEWSLYRLFELYDARATRDKLRPFFPPATSLQSVNLRAALLRQLTELKKNGILGQNAVLRKTMLDECKGDKFEELLGAFSMLVLEKVRKSAIETSNRSVPPAQLLPMVLAYRVSLQVNLKKREDAALGAIEMKKELQEALEESTKQLAVLQRARKPTVPENAETLRRTLRESWIGDPDWVNTITNGIPDAGGGRTNLHDRHPLTQGTTSVSRMKEKLQEHNERLGEMQRYLQSVRARSEVGATQHEMAVPQVKPRRFTQHEAVQLRLSVRVRQDIPLKPQHQALLDGLSAELVKTNSQYSHSARSASIAPTITERTGRPTPIRAQSTVSALSSQDTIVAEPEDDMTPVRAHWGNRSFTPQRDLTPKPLFPLHEGTRASLAFQGHSKGVLSEGQPPSDQDSQELITSSPTAKPKKGSDRTSLLERTRQSMSLLSNILNEPSESASLKDRRKSHARSKTAIHIPTQRRRLERAWSEESLSSVATKDDLDLDTTDYDSVFKSRPRLAMSPNLSPQRAGNDLWLERELQESMNKLTIDSSPEF